MVDYERQFRGGCRGTYLIEWSSNIDGFLFTGTIFESKLSAGDHTITMQVTDSGGLTTTETLFITVLSFSGNTPPTLEIISPEPASEFIHGDSVTFVGSSFDEEDGNLSNSILWVSNIDGFLHTGSSFTTTSLSIGSHVITTNVIDVLGFFNTKAILVTILDPNNLPENDPPTLLVNTPSHASVFDEGDPVLLTGTALDLQDGVLNSSIEWSDDIDGFLGIGESLTTTSLSAGDHTVTASVTDSGGLTTTVNRFFVINELALPDFPTITINSPPSGHEINEGDWLIFFASATDEEDGSLGSQIQWTSSKDGSIGTGSSFGTLSLSAGVHTITATVNDSDNNQATRPG